LAHPTHSLSTSPSPSSQPLQTSELQACKAQTALRPGPCSCAVHSRVASPPGWQQTRRLAQAAWPPRALWWTAPPRQACLGDSSSGGRTAPQWPQRPWGPAERAGPAAPARAAAAEQRRTTKLASDITARRTGWEAHFEANAAELLTHTKRSKLGMEGPRSCSAEARAEAGSLLLLLRLHTRQEDGEEAAAAEAATKKTVPPLAEQRAPSRRTGLLARRKYFPSGSERPPLRGSCWGMRPGRGPRPELQRRR
jgi:hypothetical protein